MLIFLQRDHISAEVNESVATTVSIDCQELYRLTVPISEVDMIRVKIGTVTKAKPLENSDANVYATADFIPSDGRLFQKCFLMCFAIIRLHHHCWKRLIHEPTE